jgi:hypothetical protein
MLLLTVVIGLGFSIFLLEFAVFGSTLSESLAEIRNELRKIDELLERTTYGIPNLYYALGAVEEEVPVFKALAEIRDELREIKKHLTDQRK